MASNLNNYTMKKVLFIIALLWACVGAKAQHYEYTNHVDTLTMQQLMADYVDQTHQIAKFKSVELTGIGLGTAGALISVGSALVATKNPTASRTMLIIGGVLSVASYTAAIVGYTKLKHNRLEFTPNGMVIKLTPKTESEIMNGLKN